MKLSLLLISIALAKDYLAETSDLGYLFLLFMVVCSRTFY